MKLDVEAIVRDFWKLPPLGTTQEDASRWLEHAITAYADEKLEEAAKLVDHWNMEREECAKAIRALKSTGSVSDTPAPGGAK